MNEKHVSIIAAELNIDAGQVFRTIQLFETGATIPFVARYRKEATGGLDEVVLAAIRDRKEKLEEIDKRREAILKSLTELELLTPELEKQLVSAATLAELEDIYLPYKPKRKTRASIAIEKGLEPLARFLMRQDFGDIEREARKFFSEKTGISTIDDALAGARDIVAEWVNENLAARDRLRKLFNRDAFITSEVIKDKEDIADKYKVYWDFEEQITKAPSHRVLAIFRAENE